MEQKTMEFTAIQPPPKEESEIKRSSRLRIKLDRKRTGQAILIGGGCLCLLALVTLISGVKNKPQADSGPSAVEQAFTAEQIARKNWQTNLMAWDFSLDPDVARMGELQKVQAAMTERLESAIESQVRTAGHPCNVAVPRTVQACAQRAIDQNVVQGMVLPAQAGTERFVLAKVGKNGALVEVGALNADEVTWLGLGKMMALADVGYPTDVSPDINITPAVAPLADFLTARQSRIDLEGNSDPKSALEALQTVEK